MRSSRTCHRCLQVYSGSGAIAAAEHGLAQGRAPIAPWTASAQERGVSTDHRLSAAAAHAGHLLGMTARPLPHDGRAVDAASGSSQQEIMYELVWQVAGTAAPAELAAGDRLSGLFMIQHSSTAIASMLAILQVADAHRASALDLLTARQEPTLSKGGRLRHGWADTGAASALLRTFAQESSAVVGSALTDPNAARGMTSTGGVRLAVSSRVSGRTSNAYGSRAEAAMQLSAVLLPSTVRSTNGAT